MRRALLPIALTLALVVPTGAIAADSNLWVHVKVLEDDGETKVTVNLPIRLLTKALPLIDVGRHVHDQSIQINDHRLSYSELRDIWSELRGGPDMEFVTVEEDDESVKIWKKEGFLYVEAREHHGESVDVRMPLAVVDAFLGTGDEFDFEAAIGALAEHGEGELVRVDGEDESVRVWIDTSPEAAE